MSVITTTLHGVTAMKTTIQITIRQLNIQYDVPPQFLSKAFVAL